MKIQVKAGSLIKAAADVLVLCGYEDERALPAPLQAVDRVLDGQLRDVRRSGEFSGKALQSALIHTRGALPAKRILLMGLGRKQTVTPDRVRQAMGEACKRVRRIGARAFAAPAPGPDAVRMPVADAAQAMVEGAVLGGYRFTEYRSDRTASSRAVRAMTLLAARANQVSAMRTGARRGEAAAAATWFARDLCNHPSNVMTPSRVAREARTIARDCNLKVTVLGPGEQERLGMGGLTGVSRGSREPSQFIVLEYAGGKKHDRPLALVGKTITFDSGGISLKPSENMEQMKADMTGGAEVLGAVRAAARLRLPVNVVGILPAAENMPGGRAMRPGDVLRMFNGSTVEVQNTDAEGRLILADGLAYAARRFRPACIVDVATLTGACIVALGQHAIGMLGNDDALKAAVTRAGEQAGERVWEMPLWEEYAEQLTSDVADLRNIGGRGGGMITAAVFLSKFVGDCPWVHLDIASTDWSASERPYIGKGPTAVGARLLVQLLINHAEGRGR